MEESDLLQKRLQAITEKHRIQEDIRHKKLELDQMKLQFQQMKNFQKKTLRDQWLQQDLDHHQQQGRLQDPQQTKALQLSIYRTELEVASLEREEAMISTDESFILNRLKVVERSPEDIIKEVLSRLSPELLQVHNLTTDVPDVPRLPGNQHSKPNTPSKTLFAMITDSAPPEELNPLTGPDASDGGRRHLHGLHPQQWSRDYRCASDLSAMEVDQLMRCAAGQHQIKLQLHPNAVKNMADIKAHDCWHHEQKKAQDGTHVELEDQHLCLYCKSRGHSVLEDDTALFNADGVIQGRSRINQHRSSRVLPPGPPQQDAGTAARYSRPSLRDDIRGDIGGLHCCGSPLCHVNIETENNHRHCSCLYREPRTASPLYAEDGPYTILHTLESSEPVTAIFMGLQKTQDDGQHAEEFDGCLRAELVVIRDDHSEDTNEPIPAKNPAPENREQAGAGDKWSERQVKHTSVRKLQKKKQSCCSVC
ncbi:palmdelphin-like isoform X1 [Oryzias latipes]|uniref:Palmdelphin n=1 Tax=Oryzias latipes TaxID=8090 RepID=A0A3B3HIL5_ORYLA|nr:palmdelphin-like isoform X1 [Oryzias latipes]XP_020566450.1 palmdelphin-like isoform X1 [Oryzias latipes]